MNKKIGDRKGIPRTKMDMDEAMHLGYVMEGFGDTVPTVEMLLDYVDLKLEWYSPSVNAFDMVNFIRLCVGEEPQNLNSIAHYFFIDCLFGSDEAKPYFKVRNIDFDELKDSVLILSTREFSKSTLIAYFILYMAAKGKKPGFGKVNFGVYVSDKMDGNVRTTMRTLDALYRNSAYLKGVFEWVHMTDSKCEFIRKPTTKAEIDAYNKHIASGGKENEVPGRMKRKFSIQGIGSSGGRGSRDDLDRPEFAIFDDMIGNEKDAYSIPYLDGIESTIETDIGSSLSGEGHFQVLIGTAYHTGDPVYRRVEEGTWLPVVFPKAEEPPHGDIYDSNGVLIKPAMTKENFVSVWDDRHPFEKQRRDYAKAEKAAKAGKTTKLKALDQEFYVRVTSEHERLIPESNIHWKDLGYIWANASDYNWYISTDYTTTGNSSSDNSGAFLWAVDYDENWYLMDMRLRKYEIFAQYDASIEMETKALRCGAKWVEYITEIDGQQSLHVIAFSDYATKTGRHVSFAKQAMPPRKKPTWIGIRVRSAGSKLDRLKLAAPKFHSNKVVFNSRIKEVNYDYKTLLAELKMVTHSEIKSASDDGLDTLSIALGGLANIEYPSKPIKETIEYNSEDAKNVYAAFGNARGILQTNSGSQAKYHK